MTEITAGLVKELREKTGAGMMDCKQALSESGGEMEAAVDWLRKKGLAAAAKKAGRIAAEGLIGLAVDGRARRPRRGQCRDRLRRPQRALPGVRRHRGPAGAGGRRRCGETGGAALSRHRAKCRRGADPSDRDDRGEHGACAGRLSSRSATASSAPMCTKSSAPGLGRIGSSWRIETAASGPAVEELGQEARHARRGRGSPQAVSRADVDPEALERERAVLSEQARASGKPEAIVAKMVEGRLSKYLRGHLPRRADVGHRWREQGKGGRRGRRQGGRRTRLRERLRAFGRGEGIEKRQDDFAAEVASAAGR